MAGLAQLIPVSSASQLEAAEKARREAEDRQNTPMVQGLAAHVKSRWELVSSTRAVVEEKLAKCLRQRNGEYDPDVMADIRKQGGSEIYMNLTSVKCRGASSWLRDTLSGSGVDKPWSIAATPIPELPQEAIAKLEAELTAFVQQHMQQTGAEPVQGEVDKFAGSMRDTFMQNLKEESALRVARMELKMEDQLVEGGFPTALSQFIDDIVTFPTAIMKGPIIRNRKTLKWNGTTLAPVDTMRVEWERVDPFKIYPAPWSSGVDDGFLIERHLLTRNDLDALRGVEGYDEEAIKTILSEFALGGLRNWLSVDALQAEAEGKLTTNARETDLIEALQLWDEIPGDKLIEWGMDTKDIPDKTKTYPADVWLIGNRVIRAVLNYDPLGRKPYFASSYEKVPGTFWGNSIPELIRDCQAMCNAAARSLSNNMAIASGPQVGINISRLPAGEVITGMYPWKTWQFNSSDYNDSSKPIDFFQPQSNAPELMGVFEKFSMLADEYSGIPRYMTGEQAPGAGRTASGLSMLISNASKGMKQVIANIDLTCLTPAIERLHQHNLRYDTDPNLVGDVTIVAKGAISLVAKETAAVRRNEFLQLVLNNQTAQNVVGLMGTAELLRDAAKTLDMPVDKIVPTREELTTRMQQQEQQMAQQQQAIAAEQAKLQDAELKKQAQTDEAHDMRMATGNAQLERANAQLADGSDAGGRDVNLVRNRVNGG